MTAKEQGLPEAVAFVVSCDDGSICDRIAPTAWSTFQSNLAKLQDDPWVRNGRAHIAPLFTADQMRAYALAALASDTGGRGVVANVCDGCPHLATEYWRDYLDNDETDSGTKATCNAAKRCIGVYWRAGKPSPDWCPAAALRAQPAGGGEKPWRQQRADEIEACIANGTMTVYQVFTQMRQLIATPPESGGQGEAVARELLAAELDAIGFPSMAAEVRDPEGDNTLGVAMVRVVSRALAQGGGNGR